MNINPIYLKELKTSVRTNRLYSVIFIYNGLLALFTLITFLIVFRNDLRSGVVEYAIILKVYGIIASIEFTLLLFIVPSVTASAISSEEEKRTLELLLITRVSKLQIIIGKLVSALSFVTLLAFSSLPILSLVFIIGGISFVQLFEFLVLIIVTGLFIGSIGILFSSLYKKTTLATVGTYTTVLFLLFGTIILIWACTALGGYTHNEGIELINNKGNSYLQLILLINPAITCLSMIGKQIGNGTILYELFERFGLSTNELMENWFLVSVMIQIFISVVLLIISSMLLNPIKTRRGFNTKDNKRRRGFNTKDNKRRRGFNTKDNKTRKFNEKK